MEVPFYRHDVREVDIERVTNVLRAPFLTTGQSVAEFEQKFKSLYGVEHAIGTTNWTSAAELTLRLWGIRPGDEVIVPTISYISTAHVAALCGAKPVFVDSDPETGLLDIERVENAITDRTKVIMPVHLYGVMPDMRALRVLADEHGLKIFEDAAHAVVSQRDGVYPGQLGDAAAFSFYATKNITCGEGGALITNDDDFATAFRQGTCCGVTKTAFDRRREGGSKYSGYDSIRVGGKCNMTNISASLLIGQLERLMENRRRRAELVQHYRRELATIPGLKLPQIPEDTESSYYIMVMLVQRGIRDRLFELFGEKNIGCAINFEPIHLRTVYREKFGHREGEFPVAEDWGQRCVTLPLYPSLTEDQVAYVVDTIRKNYHLLVD